MSICRQLGTNFSWTDLEPVDTPSAGLVEAGVTFEHFHHKPLATVLYALF